jgi:hypothetical protein
MGRTKAKAVTNVKKKGAMANKKRREKRLILMKTKCLYLLRKEEEEEEEKEEEDGEDDDASSSSSCVVAKKGAKTKLKQGDAELKNIEREPVRLAARIEAAKKRNASRSPNCKNFCKLTTIILYK